jgi:Ca2+-binding RTX toxin-like protein
MKKLLSTIKKSIVTKIRSQYRAKVPSNQFSSTAAAIVAMTLVSASSLAMPLVGSGRLPPGTTGSPAFIAPLYADVPVSAPVSFTGTWDATAPSAWQGTFTGTPTFIRSTANNIGINKIDFSGLPTGVLPKQSFFALGDLDDGSSSGEIITLTAWDADGDLITMPWLDEPSYQSGRGASDPKSLPDFTWDQVTGTYSFDGNGEDFRGNPSIVVFMRNNKEIGFLEVNDQTAFAGFGLSAPSTPPPPSCDINAPGAIIGTPGNDTLLGTPGDDVIFGLGGNDTIFGYGGNDCIDGGEGNDKILGGPGNDLIIGDGGNDDLVHGDSGNDTIIGGTGNDNIFGGAGDDDIDGGPGDDQINGNPGDDLITGGPGDDLITGSSGDDDLDGGSGNNVINGGPGMDTCIAGIYSQCE